MSESMKTFFLTIAKLAVEQNTNNKLPKEVADPERKAQVWLDQLVELLNEKESEK